MAPGALILATALASAAPDGEADLWVQPEKSTLRRVFGARFKAEYGEFELLATNQEQWTIPLISRDNVRAFVGTRAGVLEAWDIRGGESLWKRVDMGTIGWAMADFRGDLVVGSDSALVGLDQGSGRERWRVDLDAKMGGILTVTGTVAVVPLRPNAFAAVDLAAGEVLWRVTRRTPDGITVRGQAQPTVDEARGLVFLGFSDGALLGVDLATGTQRWVAVLGDKREFFADVDTRPLRVDGGDALLVASYNGGLFKLAAETGEILWERPLTRIHGMVRAAPGLVVASSGDGQVIGLYEKDGKVRWRYKVNKGAPTPPVAFGRDLVGFGVSEGPFTVLEAGNGRPRQVTDHGSGMSVRPAFRDPDLALLTNEGMFVVYRYGAGVGASK